MGEQQGFTLLELIKTKEGRFGDMVRASIQSADDKQAMDNMKVKCTKCKESTKPAKLKEAVEAGKKMVVGYCRACGAKVKALKEESNGKKESRRA